MAESSSMLAPLAKYTSMLVVGITALWIGEACFGIDLGRISRIGPGGIELREVQNVNAIAAAELSTRLEELAGRIGKLEDTDPGVATPLPAANDSTVGVPDAIARVQTALAPVASGSRAPRSGYIWIGNYVEGRWSSAILEDPASRQPTAASPDAIRNGDQFVVRGNMVLRDGLPPNDELYYRGRASLGVIPSGTLVRILETPTAVPRTAVVQYWARVQVAVP